MKTLKALMLLIVISLSLSSCFIFQGREKRAQTHLRKAISLDPTIIQSKDSVRFTDSTVLKDSTVVHIKDSVNIRTKDSTIIIPKSDLNGSVSNPCDSIKGLEVFDYTLGSGSHKLHIWSDGKKIYYSSTVDSLVSTIQSRDTYISHLIDSLSTSENDHRTALEKLTNTKVVLVKYQPTMLQTILRVLSGTIIGFIIGYLVRAFTKFKLPFVK